MPVERIAAFIRGESGQSFDELALAVFRFQYERIAPFRELCDQRGVTPEQISDWRQVPAVPASALESMRPAGDTPADHPHPELYRTVIDHSFPATCLQEMGRPPVLSLIPSSDQLPGSSAGLLADQILRSWAAPDSQVAFSRRGVEVAKARNFLAARQRDRRPVLILASPTALAQLLEALERRGLRFRLPSGSRLLEMGPAESGGRELLTRLADGVGLPPQDVIREYGLPELTTRFYAGYSRRGEARPFRPLPWAAVRILEPETGEEAPAGATGLISVFDLANVGSVAHLLTDDLGIADQGGFHLAGRAAFSTS